MKLKIIKDMLINLLSSVIPILALQLVILPLIASKVDADTNGLMLTLIALMTMISTSIGNVLNNIRLLSESDYKENKVSGDFNIILVVSCVFNSIIIFLGTWYYYGNINVIGVIFMLIISCLELIKEYLIVTFRIELNYFKFFISNIILLIGYGFGSLLFCFTGYWQFIYLFGLIFILVYLLLNSRLLNEKCCKTTFFKKTTKKTMILLVSVVFIKAMQYVDKLILFPLLGGTAVSIYYVATLSGKLVSMAISPINSVMLSYFSKMKELKKNIFNLMLIGSLLIGFAGYFICIWISRPIFNIIYPQWVDDSMKYVHITTMSAVVTAVSSFISPVILKFCNINWQLVINAISFVIYIIATLVMYHFYGLMGFCGGVLIANIVRLFIMIGIYYLKGSTAEKNMY